MNHNGNTNTRRNNDKDDANKDNRRNPRIVICGHEHSSGTGVIQMDEKNGRDDNYNDDPLLSGITFVNAANAKGGIRNGHSVSKQPIILTL